MHSKPWLAAYPTGVPEFIAPLSAAALPEYFDQIIGKHAQRPAFTSFGVTLTYAGLDVQSRHLCQYLLALRLPRQARVAIMLPNILQYPISLLAVLRAGLTVVNTNPLYTARELKHQLNDSGAEVIIILDNFAHVLAAVLPETSVKHVIITRLGDCFPFGKAWLTRIVLQWLKRQIPDYAIPGAIFFQQALSAGRHEAYSPPALQCEDIAFLQYTGGTTGVSKGAMLTHRNMLSNISQTLCWITHGNLPGKALIPGREVIITALPLYHIFALTANFMVFFGLGAENILIANPRDMPQFIRELQRRRFTCITGVNTLFDGLMNAAGFAALDFSALKIALAGGMPTRESTARRWRQLTGHSIIEAYGLTEASPAVAINRLDCTEFSGSIGLPLPSTDCEIRDDAGEVLPPGACGELYLRGPQVMQGYWKQPVESVKELSADGWLKTGDIASMDEQGRLFIKDRIKDMILVSGFNVYPGEVEAVLSQHPDIAECAAIGVADEKTGEAVKAFIVKRNPALDAAAVTAYCRQYLTAYKVPKLIEFRAELPKSAMGKVLRRALRNS
ncbi:MAG: long-chain-fatty-acid--CoA ligase [Methylococcaceae bacterium]|nr:MAG: long-chain-fatty-acid--CoA ligase [Methylococcaceae bacterium]